MAKKRRGARSLWSASEAAEILDLADASGLSDERFAKREGLNPQRLFYWRRKLKRGKRASSGESRRAVARRGAGSRSGRAASRRSKSSGATAKRESRALPGRQFVEIKAAVVERIEVQLRNGRLVSVPIDISPPTLAALLDAIEGSSC